MSSLIPNIQISDIPKKEAQPFKTVGVVKEVTQKEIANGYIQVTAVLHYLKDSGGESDFHARWNLRPEWFRPGYQPTSDKDKIMYEINVSGLTRGIFAAAELSGTDFDQLVGKVVGFKTKVRKDDPSNLDISFFYKPVAPKAS
jgi:hypothetical protein